MDDPEKGIEVATTDAKPLRSVASLVSRPRPSLVPPAILERYEVWEYRHASAILSVEYPEEYGELCDALQKFSFTENQVRESGGNETQIPKTFSKLLRSSGLGWDEVKLQARMLIGDEEATSETHKIDYVKNRIAFDLEWNAKDQTFDRDLAAFRAFFDFGRISVAVLVTRDTKLHDYFRTLGTAVDRHGVERPLIAKYGASTTHLDKLLPRLRAGRSGGCPVLALGITARCLLDINA